MPTGVAKGYFGNLTKAALALIRLQSVFHRPSDISVQNHELMSIHWLS